MKRTAETADAAGMLNDRAEALLGLIVKLLTFSREFKESNHPDMNKPM